VIPLIIIRFVAFGMENLEKSAGKLPGMTTLIAYDSTIMAGSLEFFTK
jgi:hypothetical protein